MEMKQKRVCKAPYHKWSDLQQCSLINFLKENRPLEKPTAQTYYRRFLNESGIECEWSLVRSKVKNMRQSYRKAKEMLDSTGAGALNNGDTMEDVIQRKCPMFHDYEEVFAYRESVGITVLLDTDAFPSLVADYSQITEVQQTSADFSPISQNTIQNNQRTIEECEHNARESHEPNSVSVETPSYRGQKGIYSRTGLSDVLQVQNEILSMRKENKERELKVKETELELQREKFIFEKEKHVEENLRKEKELQMERKLRIMEMKMKREVALKEIEMKERVEMQKMKM